jgi:hypothetical protein
MDNSELARFRRVKRLLAALLLRGFGDGIFGEMAVDMRPVPSLLRERLTTLRTMVLAIIALLDRGPTTAGKSHVAVLLDAMRYKFRLVYRWSGGCRPKGTTATLVDVFANWRTFNVTGSRRCAADAGPG